MFGSPFSKSISVKDKIFIALFFLIFILIGVGVIVWENYKVGQINSFDACVNAGFPTRNTYPNQCETPDGRLHTQTISPQQVTITGEVVCLPHKNSNGPQTLECAFGIKGENGLYYQLSDPEFKFTSDLPHGEKVTIKGTLTSVTESNYAIVGAIEVKEVVK